MTYIIGLSLLFSSLAFGEQKVVKAHTCLVRKSLVWVTEDGKLNTREAVTSNFPVVVDEHETPYSLPLLEKSGEAWGEVTVYTGTLLNHSAEGDVKQANAEVLNKKGNVVARVSAVFDIDARFARAATVLEVKGTDLDPYLAIECRVQPLR